METLNLYNKTAKVKLNTDDGKHQYTVTDTELGMKNATMRGVTDIKRQFIAKPGLMHWSKDEAIKWLKKLDRKPTEQASEQASKAYTIKSDFGKDIGTEVHSAIERYLTGTINTGVSKEAEKAFMAFRNWFENTNLKAIATEQAVYSRSRQYCGTFDALLEIEGKLVLVDFKTTNVSAYALKKGKDWTGLYPEDFMQLGFYSQAYHEAQDQEIDDVMLINCTKDGKIITLTAKEIGWSVEDCENLAMSALDIADGLKNIKKGALDMEMYK